MHFTTVVQALTLALGATAASVSSPVDLIRRQHTTGTVITKCAKPGMLALAFDDGPGQYTSKLVDTLNAAGGKATFFMTGTLYGCIYNQAAAIKKAFASGHQIASHTWSHANLGNANQGKIQSEMAQLEQAMVNIFGKKPAYMRPPFLGTGPGMLKTLAGLGYSVVTDDVDSGDWNRQTPAQSERKFEQAGAGGNGHIPLMHETYASTVNELVPWLIKWAKANNLKLVTVAECLGDANGAYQASSGTPNGVTTC